MNKVTKGFIIAAVVFIVIGFVVTLGAVAGGGLRLAKTMAENGELSYSWVWRGHHPYWTFDSDIHDEDFFDDDQEIFKDDVDKKVETKGLKCLNIDIGAGKIDINDTNDEDISIHTEDMRKVQIYRNDDTLYVKGLRSNVSDGGTIHISLPEELTFDIVDISAGASDFDAKTLRTKEIDMDLGAGRIVISDLFADEMNINVGAGSTTIKNADVKNAEVNVGMGRFALKGAITGDLYAECSMGELVLSLEGSEDDHNYDLECAAGNLRVGGSNFAGVASERNIDNGADSNFDLECSMGSLDVSFTN